MTEKLKKINVPFTIVANDVLRNTTLSWKAKGLFAYIYSKPAGWQFSVERIALESYDGFKATNSGIKELEEAGYLRREKLQDGRKNWVIDSQLAKTASCQNGNQPKSQPAKTATISNKEDYSNKDLYSNTDLHANENVIYTDPPKETFDSKKKTYAKLGIPYQPKKQSSPQKLTWDTESVARHIQQQAMDIHRIEVYVNKSESGKGWTMLKKAVREFGKESCESMADYFLGAGEFSQPSQKFEKFGADLAVMYSEHSINNFLQREKLQKNNNLL